MLRAAEAIARTDTGRQRSGNEDNAYARSPVFVVADGMGGARGGEVASQMAVEAFARGLPDDGTPEERLARCVRVANRQIHDRARSEPELEGMGTTLTAAFLDETSLAIAHVGDSRAYLFRDGELTRLTSDHSLVEELFRQGKLTREQAEEHPQRSIITRALGPEADVEVDTWSYPARDGDLLLLCSDGLTSMVGEQRIAAVLGAASEVQAAAEQLIDEANQAGGRDNITVVLVRIEDVGGADGAGEQPTMIGVAPPVRSRSATAVKSSAPALAPAPAAARGRPRRARSQGRPQDAPPMRRRRWAKPLAALVATLIVLFLVLGGGYLATRQLYFIGTNPQGIVTIYRGLPYDLPAGIHLYETYYVSGLPLADVPAARHSTLLDHHLRSQRDASSLVRALELGQITR